MRRRGSGSWGASSDACLHSAKYPNATYIELEPDSYYTFRKKLDDMEEPSMKDVNRTMFMSQLQSIMKAKSSKVADVKTPEV